MADQLARSRSSALRRSALENPQVTVYGSTTSETVNDEPCCCNVHSRLVCFIVFAFWGSLHRNPYSSALLRVRRRQAGVCGRGSRAKNLKRTSGLSFGWLPQKLIKATAAPPLTKASIFSASTASVTSPLKVSSMCHCHGAFRLSHTSEGALIFGEGSLPNLPIRGRTGLAGLSASGESSAMSNSRERISFADASVSAGGPHRRSRFAAVRWNSRCSFSL